MIPINMQMDKLLAPGGLKKDEYVDESSGLIYCGRCHTARQLKITIDGCKYMPRCLCACQREQAELKEQEQRQREFRDKVQKNRSLGLQEPILRTYTFDSDKGYNPEVTPKLKRYVEHWEEMRNRSIGLLLHGPTGTGKTYLCGCVANALLEQGVPVLMTNFARITNALAGLFAGDKNAYIDSLNRYELLVIDDLGAERDTEYVLEQVYQIVDSRYRSQLPMILSTNLPIKELQNPKDLAHARIYDRVLDRCIPLRVVGQSIRQKNAIANLEIARSILNGE